LNPVTRDPPPLPRTPPDKWDKSQKSTYVLELLRVFGFTYARSIQSQVPKQFQNTFVLIHDAMAEMQASKKKGASNQATKVQAFIHSLPMGISPFEAKQVLTRYSYEALPFLQKILLDTNREEDVFNAITKEREETFQLIMTALINPQEEKKAEKPLVFSPKEERAIIQLYCRGVLIFNGTVYTLGQLIQAWACSSHGATAKSTRFLKLLTTREWIDTNFQTLPAFSNIFSQSSFQEFLILSSIQCLKQQLGMQFNDAMLKYFQEQFKNEEIRSDVCYFTADSHTFLKMAFNFQRDSQILLANLQFFVSLGTDVLSPEEKNALLFIVVHRDPEKAESGPQARALLKTSMQHLNTLISILHREPLNQPEWATLFVLLRRSKNAQSLVCSLEHLAAMTPIQMTLPILLEFCQAYEGASEGQLALLMHTHQEIFAQLPDIEHGEKLFLSPIAKVSETPISIQNAPTMAQQFIETMRTLNHPVDLGLLRQCIFAQAEDLLKGLLVAQRAGLVITEDILRDAFKDYQPIGNPANMNEEMEQEWIQIYQNVQSLYHFKEEEAFDLFVEIGRLILETKIPELSRMLTVISEFERFGCFLRPKTIHYLLKHHPPWDTQIFSDLKSLRTEYAKVPSRHRISQEMMNRIMQKIEEISGALASMDEGIQQQIALAIRNAFFPPDQVLSDVFRFNKITKEGVEWETPEMATHVGQLKLIPGSPVGIYLHWQKRPTLTLFCSFFNIKTKEASSGSVPLRISLDQDHTELWSFLKNRSQEILTSENYGSLSIQGKLRIAETFLENVKNLYRELHLITMGELSYPVLTKETELLVASLGRIYVESWPRGALLPDSYMLLTTQQEVFIPDAHDGVEGYRTLFQRTSSKQPLGLQLNLPKGERPVVSYQVELPEESEEREEEIQTTYVTLSIPNGPEVRLMYPEKVLLDLELFQTYFDLHNLLLKREVLKNFVK